ncbi:hypothetical protein EK0264_03660 [Epidermidibacterium keratini]|uniref:Uncharacterized protein n=1 Tax=Epidermidibacterium keratini TaxID=1891644 RepID=A0A7L4YLN7_9ACTN|nr:hypothetical protein [Epidermidibacterium keratini]QHB99466.1 hypothetical protein EK0264_03660 [Epidermidibacterium keratini]
MTAYDPDRIAAIREQRKWFKKHGAPRDTQGEHLDELLDMLEGAKVEYALARVKPSIHRVILRDIGKPYWPTADAARSDFPPLGDEGVVCRLATPWMEVIE